MTKTVEDLIESFIKSTKKVVEISIAMHIEEIEKNTDKGLKKALDYVLNIFLEKSPLPEDVLVLCIKTALAVSLEEQGYIDNKYNQSIIDSMEVA